MPEISEVLGFVSITGTLGLMAGVNVYCIIAARRRAKERARRQKQTAARLTPRFRILCANCIEYFDSPNIRPFCPVCEEAIYPDAEIEANLREQIDSIGAAQ